MSNGEDQVETEEVEKKKPEEPTLAAKVAGCLIILALPALAVGILFWVCSGPEDNPPEVVSVTATPTPTLGVSLSKIQGLFENTGYQPFDRFSDTERAAMYFDGGGGAVIVSLYGYPSDIESIGVSFSGLNETMVVALTVEILMEELAPDWTGRVRDWVYDNYPTGGSRKTKMIAGPLLVTLSAGDLPSGRGWQAELLLERR